MIEVHHPALAFIRRRWPDKKIVSHLNLGRPKFLTDPIALILGQNIATLDDHHFAGRDRLTREKPPALDAARALFDLRREVC